MMVSAVFSIAKAEVRMTLRNLGFWFYLFFVTLIVNLVFVYSRANPLRETIVQVVNNVLFFQFPLQAIIITPALTRNQHSSREWVWATQIDYPLFLAGQIFGLILLFSFASVFIPCLVTFAWMVFEKSSFIDFSVVWKSYTLLLLPVTFLETSIIVSVTCLTRNSIISITFIMVTAILTWLGVLMPFASLLTYLNYTLLTLYFDPVAGLGAEKELIETLLFFYFSVGLWSLSISFLGNVLLFSREQTRQGSKIFLMVLSGFSVGIMILAYGLYGSESKQKTVPPPPSQIQIDTWKSVSDSYIGSISDNQLKLESELTLINASNDTQTDLFLSLNPGLTCENAKVNNETAICERKGEFVHIPLPALVKPSQKISVTVLYHGNLVLLREDYSLAYTTSGYSPPSFQNSVYSYLQNDIVYLHRDGNWKIHPLSFFSPVGATTITLSVPISSKMVSTGKIIQQDSLHITYQWTGTLPQILLASAPYIIETLKSNDKIFLGVYSDQNDFHKATLLLAFKKSLDSKFGLSADSQQTVIMLPYLHELIFSDSIIGLPVKYNNQNDLANSLYLLAREGSFAWLIDHISWQRETSTTGHLRSFETVCDEPDDTGYQECRTISLGKYNIQSPQGRVTYQFADNNVLYALQTILALNLLNNSQNEFFVKHEYESWFQKAECNNDVILLPTDIQKARWIAAIYQLFDKIGEDDTSKLLHFLTEKYGTGSLALTEQEFLQTIELFQYTQNYLPEFRAVLSCNMVDNLMEDGK